VVAIAMAAVVPTVVDQLSVVKVEMVLALVVMAVVVMVVDMIRAVLLLDAIALLFPLLLSINLSIPFKVLQSNTLNEIAI
jgi:hypothetical protein